MQPAAKRLAVRFEVLARHTTNSVRAKVIERIGSGTRSADVGKTIYVEDVHKILIRDEADADLPGRIGTAMKDGNTWIMTSIDIKR